MPIKYFGSYGGKKIPPGEQPPRVNGPENIPGPGDAGENSPRRRRPDGSLGHAGEAHGPHAARETARRREPPKSPGA